MKDLNRLLDSALAMCDEVGIPYGTIKEIKLNNRLSRAWGRCLTSDGRKTFWIEIQGKFAQDEFSTDKAVIAVIIHEIIHTCEGCWNHGSQFMAYGKLITDRFGIKVAATDSPENLTVDSIAWNRSKKYEVKCNCRSIYKDRMCDIIRFPRTYTCNYCHGNFERVR